MVVCETGERKHGSQGARMKKNAPPTRVLLPRTSPARVLRSRTAPIPGYWLPIFSLASAK